MAQNQPTTNHSYPRAIYINNWEILWGAWF